MHSNLQWSSKYFYPSHNDVQKFLHVTLSRDIFATFLTDILKHLVLLPRQGILNPILLCPFFSEQGTLDTT